MSNDSPEAASLISEDSTESNPRKGSDDLPLSQAELRRRRRQERILANADNRLKRIENYHSTQRSSKETLDTVEPFAHTSEASSNVNTLTDLPTVPSPLAGSTNPPNSLSSNCLDSFYWLDLVTLLSFLSLGTLTWCALRLRLVATEIPLLWGVFITAQLALMTLEIFLGKIKNLANFQHGSFLVALLLTSGVKSSVRTALCIVVYFGKTNTSECCIIHFLASYV